MGFFRFAARRGAYNKKTFHRDLILDRFCDSCHCVGPHFWSMDAFGARVPQPKLLGICGLCRRCESNSQQFG